MMCYRDRTFCSGPCERLTCSRQITPAVTAAADRAVLPLAIADLRTGCSLYLPPAAAPPEEDRPAAADPE